ncbi:hypothetical protein [Enterobacter cloacae]|uniref:hypothetical protein n=1 Tax=Enterobacter cloacae TaxID=550 RepID=UPI0033152715
MNKTKGCLIANFATVPFLHTDASFSFSSPPFSERAQRLIFAAGQKHQRYPHASNKHTGIDAPGNPPSRQRAYLQRNHGKNGLRQRESQRNGAEGLACIKGELTRRCGQCGCTISP